MSQVFISYRRADELGGVGRIHDWLALTGQLGPEGVFMDVEDIPPGEDFRVRITHQMDQADVVLALIGANWLETIPARAADPNDYVRFELELAFARHLPVIPVLLGRHLLKPSRVTLPPSIARIAFLNAAEIDPGTHFRPGMERLLQGIQRHREARDQPQPFRNPHGIAFAGIRRGSFLMGATPATDPEALPEEGPETEVTIPHGFWMGKYPVTVEEYGRIMGQAALAEILARVPIDRDPAFVHHREARKPITHVTWDEAAAFCERLTNLEQADSIEGRTIIPPGYEYRLPRSAEWEYACRAGIHRAPRYGELQRVAWTAESGGRFADVGELEANAWGLHDMLGLVFEWCVDDWGGSGQRIIRGGSYHEPARLARASAWMVRDAAKPSARVGFRVALGPVR